MKETCDHLKEDDTTRCGAEAVSSLPFFDDPLNVCVEHLESVLKANRGRFYIGAVRTEGVRIQKATVQA